MEPYILFTGAAVMIALGLGFRLRSYESVGAGLFWIGIACL